MSGLSVQDVVSVTINMSPTGASERNFGALLILGDSTVIDTQTRLRPYTALEAIGADFGETAPEYLAAQVYFGQTPTPAECYVGRWASSATHGRLYGGSLSASQQALANFTVITNGGLDVTVDGTAHNLTGLNFSAQTNLNGVASAVQTALGGAATVTWNPTYGYFLVQSASTGASSAVSFATTGAGTDISGLLGLTQGTSGAYTVVGEVAETIEAAVNTVALASNDWYGLQIAATAAIADADYGNVAAIVQGLSLSHIFGVTTQEAAAFNPQSTTDLGALLAAGGYTRTFWMYSSSNPYASAGIFGVEFTTDFSGVDTIKTVKFQQIAGVTAETLTEAQWAAIAAKNGNVYVQYDDDTAIVQEGTMANGYFFDEVYGTDWLQSQLQTDVFDEFLTIGTKISQTDAGVNRLVTVISDDLVTAVGNGLIAGGVWNGPPIGAISTGQTIPSGFYVFAPSIATQSQAQRQKRQAPTIQAAIILAGAIHFAGIVVNVNR